MLDGGVSSSLRFPGGRAVHGAVHARAGPGRRLSARAAGAGREGLTALHLAADQGRLEVCHGPPPPFPSPVQSGHVSFIPPY